MSWIISHAISAVKSETPQTGCRAHLRTTQTRTSQTCRYTPYPRKGLVCV